MNEKRKLDKLYVAHVVFKILLEEKSAYILLLV